MMYCAAVRRISDTLSSRLNIISRSSLLVSLWPCTVRSLHCKPRKKESDWPTRERMEIRGPPSAPYTAPLTTNDQRPTTSSRPLLKLIQQEVQPHPPDSICQSGEDSVAPTPIQRQVHHAAGNGEVNRLVQQIKTQSDQQARSGIFHIELCSQRRRTETHHSLRNPIDSDRIRTQHVLRQSDRGSRKQSGNRIAPRHSEENRHQQRQVENRKDSSRQERLQKQSDQRHAYRHRKAEPVDLDLLP